jgi:hypothetical protein
VVGQPVKKVEQQLGGKARENMPGKYMFVKHRGMHDLTVPGRPRCQV